MTTPFTIFAPPQLAGLGAPVGTVAFVGCEYEQSVALIESGGFEVREEFIERGIVNY
jgi:hypothetical protein